MMSKTRFIVSMVCILTLSGLQTTSCTTDPMETQKESCGVPVSFTMGFPVITTRAEATTLDNIWTANKQHIAVKNMTTNSVQEYVPKETSATSVASVPLTLVDISETYYWPQTNPNWTFTAWYPYAASAPSGITVAEDQQSSNVSDADYLNYDLLYAPTVTPTFLENVPLVFYHQMARVVVTVNSSYTENQDEVTLVKFGKENISLTASLSPGSTGTNGTASWSSYSNTGKTIIMRNTSTDAGKALNVYTFECMLPPQSGGSTSTTLLTISTNATSDNNFEYKNAFNLMAGNQYNYDMAVSAAGRIIIISATVTGWDSPTVNIGNAATFPDVQY